MKRRFQIIISVSVLLLLILGTVTFTFITRRLMFRVLVDQIIEDNKVIGEQVLDIIGLLDYEDISEEKLIDYLQRFCDEVMLPNEGFICVADSEGRLIAFPGLGPGEEMFIDRADFFSVDGEENKEFSEIQSSDIFSGFFKNPEAGSDDIIVTMPVGDTGLRILVHQSRSGVYNRAREITRPFLFMQLGFSILISFVIFLLVNAQVKRYESTLETLNADLSRVNTQRMQLLHMLSHDLANPIGAIKSVCDLCYKEPETEARGEFHRMVMDSVGRSMGIIGLVRKMEALETGKLKLELQPIRVRPILEESVQVLRNRFAGKNLLINIAIPEDATVLAEIHSLGNTVFMNILSNAVKFSPPSSQIEITSKEEETHVDIIITDHGIGIPPELREKLFDIGSSTTRPGTNGESGTGFGMPLVKSFVEHFGGSIQVVSKTADEDPENHGTTVVIRLRR